MAEAEKPNNVTVLVSNPYPSMTPILTPSPHIVPGFRVGIALRHARENIGWTIDDISRRTGISPREVVGIEEQSFTMFYGHLPLLETKLRIYARKTGSLSDDMDSMIRETIESLKPQIR